MGKDILESKREKNLMDVLENSLEWYFVERKKETEKQSYKRENVRDESRRKTKFKKIEIM